MSNNETVIKNIIEVNASPKTLFSALTDEKEITCWFPDQVLLEPKLGGHVEFAIQTCSEKNIRNYVIEGKISEFIPNRKLSYICNQIDEISFPQTLVSIELEEIDTNRTRIIYNQTILETKQQSGLTQWRSLLREPLCKKHEDLSDDWNTCAIGEITKKDGKRIKNIDELNPESILLGYDFFMAIKNKRKDIAIDIIQKLEKSQTVWK